MTDADDAHLRARPARMLDTVDYGAEYARLRAPCVAAACRRHHLTDDEAEVVYQTAWVELWGFVRSGNQVRDLQSFLLDVMDKRWKDELRRAHRRHEVAVGDVAGDGAALRPAEWEDRVHIRHAAEALQTVLSDDRIRGIFYLVWFEGMTREQAALEVGLEWSRPLEKRIDRASRRLREALGLVRAGEWCRAQQPLMREYAEGGVAAGSGAWRRARGHLDHCPSCRHYVLVLRGMRILGPPPILLASLTAGGSLRKSGLVTPSAVAKGGGIFTGQSMFGTAGAKVAIGATLFTMGAGTGTAMYLSEQGVGGPGAPAAVRGPVERLGDDRGVAVIGQAVARSSASRRSAPSKRTSASRKRSASKRSTSAAPATQTAASTASAAARTTAASSSAPAAGTARLASSSAPAAGTARPASSSRASADSFNFERGP